MGYYDMAAGDAPILRFISDHYATSDNDHQMVMGSSAANAIALGSGYVASYPRGRRPPRSDGSSLRCTAGPLPGAGAIRSYLRSLPYRPFRAGDCRPGRSYLLGDLRPAYHADGSRDRAPGALPPQHQPTIADALDAHHLGWAYYAQDWHGGHPTARYCALCNPFQSDPAVMTHPAGRAHIRGLAAFLAAARHGRLPAASFLKPDRARAGHPRASSLRAFGRFVARAADAVISDRAQFAHTAIFVTMDESGGYYDSGYVQPLDVFGDGPRVPLQVISPYTRAGHIDHTYADHASILKFIERNWRLAPLSARSLDELPNPTPRPGHPYVPANRPAIGDLMGLSDFHHRRPHPPILPRR
jgi:phospholipase C